LSIFFQPVTQFLAAFPANLLFPVTVIAIVHYSLVPNIWLTPLIIFGSQWYILFNVISGSASFPVDLKEISTNLQLKGWVWCKKIMLPAIAPHYVTGAITAYGGAWNASIIAEVVSYGDKRIIADGIGSYIAIATTNADFPRVVLGIGVMSLWIILINKLFWQPVHNYVYKL
jgi:NitT/TauT family transport system permease protein